jgi:haloalkane dehalogenase
MPSLLRSMELMEDLNPEEARAIVARARKLMIDACRRYGEYVSVSTRPRGPLVFWHALRQFFPAARWLRWTSARNGVRFVRTLDANFAGLPDYPFTPNYIQFEGLRLHYVDEGPRAGRVALLMHGMPTWSFLNRHLIFGLVRAGYHCVAADHIGFGKSDKVIDDSWYTIARHVAAHRALIEQLDLRNVTLFCHDWGGPIGLAQAAETPERFLRLVILNTWLHHGAFSYTPALREWNASWKEGGFFRLAIPERMSIGDLMAVATGMAQPADIQALVASGTPLPIAPEQREICRGYAAPFEGLGEAGLAGPRRFPLSLPFDNPEGGAGSAFRGAQELDPSGTLHLGRDGRCLHRGVGPELGRSLSRRFL